VHAPLEHDSVQQSLAVWHGSPVSAQPHVLFTHCDEQHVEASVQPFPSSVQVDCAVAQVDVLVSHTSRPQQSASLPHPALSAAQPHVPSTHRLEQHSEASRHDVPSTLHWFTHVLLVVSQRSVPQQSALDVQSSPAARHPHVLVVVSHNRAPQQSALLEHGLPVSAQAHVLLVASQSRAPQQSALLVHPWKASAQPHVWFTHCDEQHCTAFMQVRPSSRQAPPSLVPPSAPPVHVKVFWSQSSTPQQSKSVMQSLPWPAHAGVHVLS
jgi:hypothetical protein